MTAIEQAIRDALKGGWNDDNFAFGSKTPEESMAIVDGWEYDEKVFIDPSFWQALGKAWELDESEQSRVPQPRGVPVWQLKWHRFIDHLAGGKDAESFFASL